MCSINCILSQYELDHLVGFSDQPNELLHLKLHCCNSKGVRTSSALAMKLELY